MQRQERPECLPNSHVLRFSINELASLRFLIIFTFDSCVWVLGRNSFWTHFFFLNWINLQIYNKFQKFSWLTISLKSRWFLLRLLGLPFVRLGLKSALFEFALHQLHLFFGRLAFVFALLGEYHSHRIVWTAREPCRLEGSDSGHIQKPSALAPFFPAPGATSALSIKDADLVL